MSEAGNKRQGGGEGGPNKKKRQFVAGRTSTGPAIPTGAKGILVTCEGGRERRSGDEVVAMVEEAFEELAQEQPAAAAQPAGEQQPGGDAAAAATEGEGVQVKVEGEGVPVKVEGEPAKKGNIDDLLAAEVAQLKDKKKDRFKWHDTGVRGSFFLIFPYNEPDAPSPVAVVQHILSKAKRTQVVPGRFTTKLLPVTHTCFAGLDDIKAMAPKLVEGHFPTGDGAQPVAFAVEFDHRASEKLKRLDVINAIVAPIATPPHKVNLGAPQKTVLVQLVRGACACAVVEQFKQLAKFNVAKVAEPPEEAAAAAAAASGGGGGEGAHAAAS